MFDEGKTMYIIVIEEERAIQDLLLHALALEGHHVEVYDSVPATLPPCDLIILEPGEEGQGFPQTMQLATNYHVPVVIFTFHVHNMVVAKSLYIPAIRKMPLHLAQLRAMIAMVSKGCQVPAIKERCG